MSHYERYNYYARTGGRPITMLRPESEETIFAILKSEQRKEVRRKKRLARGR